MNVVDIVGAVDVREICDVLKHDVHGEMSRDALSRGVQSVC